MTPERFFTHCWTEYVDLAPQAKEIWETLKQTEQQIVNDHIALRTFAWEGIDLNTIGDILLQLGYHPKEEYHFKEKSLVAKHFDAGEDLPLIFVSEYHLQDLPKHLKEVIEKSLSSIHEPLSLSRLSHFRPWPAFEKAFIDEVWDHSEYAGWVLCHGIRVNHYTINVNALESFSDLESLNQKLLEKNFILNEAGGLIKGSKSVGLTQSSTMAPLVNVRCADGKFEYPGCYVEFAERHHVNGKLFRSFLGASANKIFESTHK